MTNEVVSFSTIRQVIHLFNHIAPVQDGDDQLFRLRSVELNDAEIALLNASFGCVNSKITCARGEGAELIARVKNGSLETLPAFLASRELETTRDDLLNTTDPAEFDYLGLDVSMIVRIANQLRSARDEMRTIDC